MSSRRISVQQSAACPMQRMTPPMRLFERGDVAIWRPQSGRNKANLTKVVKHGKVRKVELAIYRVNLYW